MHRCGYRRTFLLGLIFFASLVASAALADPCLVVYPTGGVIYHYDPMEYYTVGPGDPLYDPMYDRGGEVLIDANDNQIALDVYQAPDLIGFEMDSDMQGYYFEGTSFDLVIDGFNNEPITYTNILLVVDFLPSGCPGNVYIDGNPALFDPGLGWYYPLGDLQVMTPTPDGNNYSDTLMVHVNWDSCVEAVFWAFADEDFNLDRGGGECFSAYSHDTTVPTGEASWSNVKARFR
jgi:hypothetical protein